ncbi:MAG: ABC transporter substrate-binding protein [Treponema sp.]|jgi:peptide/nickel transport system substrate-binding protein|nr:ABC transporter substrate-binding protein [Treponema sp.]
MKKMRLFFVLSLILLIAGAAFAGGQGGSAQAGSGGPKDTMVAGLAGLSTAIDPMLANFSNVTSIGKHIYNTLLAYDDNNRVVGQIATSWTRPDALTWEFTVDTASYKFQTGDPLTMEDIIFSLERCRTIPHAMDYVDGVISIRAEGNKLILKTDAPNNGLLYKLTSVVITSKKAVEAAGDNWGQIAVGTGPYKLVSFIPSNEVVIERWDGHPSLKPAIRKITFRAINDPTSRYIGIENGEFDFVDQVTGVGDIRRARANTKLNAEIVKTLGMRFMAVNASKAPFDNPLVREALQYTIDRASIISLLNGIDEPANTMISGVLPAHSDVQIGQFDPARAKQLLAQAGYPNGFSTSLWIYSDAWKTIAEMMQAVLAQAGITVTIEQYQIGAFFELLDAGEHFMLLGNQTAEPYAVTSLEMYYSSDFFGSSGNFGFYTNPRAMDLIRQALATMDPEEEIRLSRQIQEVVAKDSPYYPISYTADCRVVVKNLKGYKYYTYSQWYFGDAYFE